MLLSAQLNCPLLEMLNLLASVPVREYVSVSPSASVAVITAPKVSPLFEFSGTARVAVSALKAGDVRATGHGSGSGVQCEPPIALKLMVCPCPPGWSHLSAKFFTWTQK